MRNKNLFLASAAVLAGVFLAGAAHASTPILSVSGSSANAVQVTVNGADPNANVIFYYNSGAASKVLGVTDAGGNFSAQINTSGYDPAVSSGSSVYVSVNGQQSAAQTWNLSGGTTTSGSGPTLSQTNVTVGLGQTVTVTSQGSTTGVYMLSNTNSAAANVQTSGVQVSVTGSQLGTATAVICYVGTSSSCTNLNITVQSSSVVSFNPSGLTLAVGQSYTATVSGGNGTYTVSTNSNPAAASVSLSGSILTVSGLTAGTASITVCDSASNCGTLAVTVNAVSTGSVVFGNSSPTVGVGGSMNLSLAGGSGYYVASNSNSAAVSASVSGNSLYLTGLANGAATLSICGTGVTCGTLTVTVGTGSTTTTTTTSPPSNANLLATIQSMQSQLQQILSQIQTMATTLSQLAASAVSGQSGTTSTTSSAGSFTLFLSMGSQNSEVTLLQQRLTALGFYSGPITGYFGSLTEEAVIKYQTARGISAKGYVGPETRSVLNSGK